MLRSILRIGVGRKERRRTCAPTTETPTICVHLKQIFQHPHGSVDTLRILLVRLVKSAQVLDQQLQTLGDRRAEGRRTSRQ